MKERYKFDEKQHLHQLNVDGKWENLTGCTTILSVIAKPALIQWSANEAVRHIEENLKDAIQGIIDWSSLFQEARIAHRKKKEKAGDWGTEIHKEIENYIKAKIEGKDYDYPEKIKSFVEWVEKNKVIFIESEKNIYSEKLWIGGIVDFVCEIDGQRWIGDIKISKSGIYPEHFWQTAGYDLMLQDMGEPEADGYIILNLKENGEFLEKRSVSNSDNIKAFKSCLNIYRIKEKIKNNII